MFISKPMWLRVKKIVNIKYSKNPERVEREKIKSAIFQDLIDGNQEVIDKVSQKYSGFMALVELYDDIEKLRKKMEGINE